MDLRDPALHEFMRPDFTQIYLTRHYTNLRDLTLHEFMVPRVMSGHVNLCNVRLRKFM
jgi:hypothetical protein